MSELRELLDEWGRQTYISADIVSLAPSHGLEKREDGELRVRHELNGSFRIPRGRGSPQFLVQPRDDDPCTIQIADLPCAARIHFLSDADLQKVKTPGFLIAYETRESKSGFALQFELFLPGRFFDNTRVSTLVVCTVSGVAPENAHSEFSPIIWRNATRKRLDVLQTHFGERVDPIED